MWPLIFKMPCPSYRRAISFRNEIRREPILLDLGDRVPDELWAEVHDTLQEKGIKAIPKKNKYKKSKRLSEEALQTAVKRREMKSKGKKERYTHLNAEFQ